MRCLIGFMFVLAGLMALPPSASAQAGEEPATEEPALQLKLDDAGVEVAPNPPRTADGYTLDEMDRRVLRAGIGLGVSAAVLVTGGVLLGLGASQANVATGEKFGLLGAGIGVTFVGVVTTITTGVMLRNRRRDRDGLRQTHHKTARRAQWDLAQSRVVF